MALPDIYATNKKPAAFITGINGQDGSYLAELLLEKGYTVHGLIRRASSINTSRIDHLYEDPQDQHKKLHLHYGDMDDGLALARLLQSCKPDEVYNLAAQSHVKVSFENPEHTAQVDGLGTLRLLEAIRLAGLGDSCRFYQASTSELFGSSPPPQSEITPFWPQSPYASSKLYAYWITANYREAYGMFACNGILFNHESPRRGETFVTRKITRAVAAIAFGQQEKLTIGNLEARRDWGHARDYVKGMWAMLQQAVPEDFVLATGKAYSVREFIEAAFLETGSNIQWRGQGLEEVGVDSETGKILVEVSPRYMRPLEVHQLCGDASLARKKLGWVPETNFQTLVREMVQSDLQTLRNQRSGSGLFIEAAE